MKLERAGRGLYRVNGRYPVDVIFGLCGCRDFETRNGKKKRKKGEAEISFVAVCCKHLIAVEEAEGLTDRRDHDPVLGRSTSTSPLIHGAGSKADGAMGGRAR